MNAGAGADIKFPVDTQSVAVQLLTHRNTVSDWERFCLQHNARVLTEKPFFFVLPKGLDAKPLLEMVPNAGVKYAEASHFQSADNYNRFCLMDEYYELFADYNKILTIQSDVLVFHNRMGSWLKRDDSLVGAPGGFLNADRSDFARLVPILNTGLGLRDVRRTRALIASVRKLNIYRILDKARKEVKLMYNLPLPTGTKNRVKDAMRPLRALLPAKNFGQWVLEEVAASKMMTEETFTSLVGNKFDQEFRAIAPQEAMFFSVHWRFDVPYTRYLSRKGDLFGCHDSDLWYCKTYYEFATAGRKPQTLREICLWHILERNGHLLAPNWCAVSPEIRTQFEELLVIANSQA